MTERVRFLLGGDVRKLFSSADRATYGAVPRRASRVEAVEAGPHRGRFHVDFSPLSLEHQLCLLETFTEHDEAVAAERAWLLEHWILETVPNNSPVAVTEHDACLTNVDPTRGPVPKELQKRILIAARDRIRDEPKAWAQHVWSDDATYPAWAKTHCGTRACVAGHIVHEAAALGVDLRDCRGWVDTASRLIELDSRVADVLFSANFGPHVLVIRTLTALIDDMSPNGLLQLFADDEELSPHLAIYADELRDVDPEAHRAAYL